MTNIILNEEQNNVYNNLLNFLRSDESEVLLIGYAGTGKTTLITKFINDIINNKLVKRIAIAAPTHKAVGIIKNKLYGNIYEKENSKILMKYVEVLTIHRLLNYQNYIDNNGNTYFAKGLVDTNWDIYNLIVIDECSMLNNQIINDIILELERNYEENKNNKLKVIYLGDPAQLPPVNQKISKIFTRDITKYYLEKIIRTNNNNIMDLSNQHRKWILSGNDDDMPNLELYNSNTIKIHDNTSVWLNNFINNNNKNNIILSWTNKKCNLYNDYIRKSIFKKENLSKYELGEILIFQDYYRVKIGDNKDINNYINFYTSEQVKLYDINMKKTKFDNLKVKKTSNILPENINNIYTDYVEKLNKIIDDNPIKIYELQVRKINSDENIYFDNFNNLKKKIEINIYKSKSKILTEYDKMNIINNIDKNINYMNNLVYKYNESLINDDLINENIAISTIHEDDIIKYNELIEIGNIKLLKLKEKLYSKINKIKNIDNIEKCNLFSIIEKKMNTLWKEWQNKIIDSIAQLNYGYCITVHKSQGSTFSNVYIDIADIFENKSKDEVLKCLYTAITRTSDSLELLL
jgi:ATP-dependent exoDNAse (exonuclease V) alpha subunit